jgi:hypothetical protein
MKLKIKKNTVIIIVIIIVIIGLFIILGIPLLTKTKEGLTEAEAPAFSTKLFSAIDGTMAEAGLPKLSEAPGLLDQLTGLIEQGMSAEHKAYGATAAADAATPAINTVVPTCTDTSFFYGSKMSDAFCHKNSNGNHDDLNNKCAALTEDSCNIADCCVWVNGSKCAAGDADGPTIVTGIESDTDYYFHKYQCYGNNCETEGDRCLQYKDTDRNIPDNCLEPLWKNVGCSAPLPSTGWWKIETKTTVANEMSAWASLPDYTHRASCYGNDKNKWPDLDNNYKRVYGNNGSVSCAQYCNNAEGKAELPPSWKGAICAAAGQDDDGDCNNVQGASIVNTQCICRKNDSTPWAI